MFDFLHKKKEESNKTEDPENQPKNKDFSSQGFKAPPKPPVINQNNQQPPQSSLDQSNQNMMQQEQQTNQSSPQQFNNQQPFQQPIPDKPNQNMMQQEQQPQEPTINKEQKENQEVSFEIPDFTEEGLDLSIDLSEEQEKPKYKEIEEQKTVLINEQEESDDELPEFEIEEQQYEEEPFDEDPTEQQPKEKEELPIFKVTTENNYRFISKKEYKQILSSVMLTRKETQLMRDKQTEFPKIDVMIKRQFQDAEKDMNTIRESLINTDKILFE